MTDVEGTLVKIDASGVYYRDLNTKLREVVSNGADIALTVNIP